MEIYIDYNCFVSFLKLNKDRDYYECERVLLNQLHINFTFSKELLLKDESILKLYSIFSEYRGNNDVIDTFGSISPLDTNDNYYSSIFLTDKKYNNSDNIIIGNSTNIIETLKKIFIDNHYNLVHKIELINFKWENIKINYCTDIIITDRYFLSNYINYNYYNDAITFKSIFKHNFGYFFKSILSKLKKKINIVIFTDGEINGKKLDKQQISNVIKNLESYFNTKQNITIVCCDNKNHPHDRCIISNYIASYCGDSFSRLFKYEYENKQTYIDSKGFYVEIDSLANYNEFKIANSILDKLNSLIINNKSQITGHKISTLLRF